MLFKRAVARRTASLTVGGLQVLDAIEALGLLGLPSDALAIRAGIDRGALTDAAARVPLAAVLALFDEAEQRSGDALVGLHAGARTEPHSPLMYLLLSSARLGRGLEAWRRFGALIADGLEIDVGLDADVAHLTFRGPDLSSARMRHVVEYFVTKCVRALSRALGTAAPIRAVDFAHAPVRPGDAARVLGCSVRWEQPACRLLLPARGLEHSPALANPSVAAEVERLAASLTPGGAAKGLCERVAEETRSLLVAGRRADRTTLGARLHMSPRTLQRRLEAEGTTLKAARDAALWETVEALLATPHLTVEAVALSVGFADLPSFSKAFKRRVGRSPSAWRREHRPG